MVSCFQRRLFCARLVLVLVWSAVLALVATDCGGHRNPRNLMEPDVASDAAMVEPLYRFTASLYQSMKEAKENLIFSPLSIQSALNMLSLGVTDGSQTEKDLIETLGYANMSTSRAERHETNKKYKSILKSITAQGADRKNRFGDGPTVLDMINVAIVQSYGIKPGYLKDAENYYEAIVRQIKNQADEKEVLDEVNKWGKGAGFSDDILKRDDLSGAALTLMNAIRVEATWFDKFHKTKIGELFYNHGRPENLVQNTTGLAVYKSDVNFVEFTRNEKSAHRARNLKARAKNPTHYDELAGLEFRAIDIGLSGGVSYTIIEPLSSSSGDELAKLEGELMKFDAKGGVTRLTKLTDILDKSDRVKANIEMPGFKFEQDIDLKKHLESIGLGRIFGANTADLDKMSDGKLYIGKAMHKAMIEVNENGIKAAAVTKLVALFASMSYDEVIDVHVRNPYFYLLRHHKVPMFAGHIVHV